ncbi:MAG: rhodanese-like domain-containing protein [Ignavibacteria bacterium]|nr:rhodanese-like domain-containing protein [Ignavibacteria bacterium]
MNSNKSFIKILMLLAILFALLAVVAGSPYKITIQPVSINEEFEIEGKSIKVIDVQELAKWIIDKRDDFYLVDTRVQNEFEKYHIPFALSISGEKLIDASVDKKEAIIIYDKSSRYSIKNIKPLINIRNEEVYFLKGGMDGWINEILFPDLRENNNLSKAEIEKIYKTSTYFGGKPTLDKGRPKRKYKREGC